MNGRLKREECILAIIDVQEKFIPVLDKPQQAISNIIKLENGADILGIPIIITEQYPKGIGKTVDVIVENACFYDYFEKDTFSCFRDNAFKKKIKSMGKTQIILAGIETHICVMKTAFDALVEGFEVYLAADATTSRTVQNRELGITRMMQAGVFIESTESILFSFIERSDTGEFKRIYNIIK
ncbi:MAG: hydrolase [Candidatus Methanofastidiosia archaeon]